MNKYIKVILIRYGEIKQKKKKLIIVQCENLFYFHLVIRAIENDRPKHHIQK